MSLFKQKPQDSELTLTHDAVMGSFTGAHEHLVLCDAANKKKLEAALVNREKMLAESDAEIALLEQEQAKIDRSMKFFSAFASGADVPAVATDAEDTPNQ